VIEFVNKNSSIDRSKANLNAISVIDALPYLLSLHAEHC